ncbi:MAG: hypothetical protein B6I24_04380 [Bacteroidetes bacterium 4572_128]|nr:MAG: hypothetical protein B6I24_04380 [Bacteroidetes bacterium 4572_128]
MKKNKLILIDPEEVILKYNYLIKNAVNIFIKKGYFSYSEKKDVSQEIIYKILLKLKKIEEKYNNKKKFSNYITKIIFNICNDIIRKKYKNQETKEYSDFILSHKETNNENVNSSNYEIFINEEMDILDKIFKLFLDEKFKIIICLKLYFNIKLEKKNLKKYSKKKYDFNKLMKIPHKILKKDIFIILNNYINFCENKNSSTDNLRIYVKKKIKTIIKYMNGVPLFSNYDEISIGILFEKYCKKYNI